MWGWGYGPGQMMGYGNGWGGGWMMLFGGFFWIILLAVGIAAVVWIVRSGTHGGHYLPPPRIDRGSSGLDILEERYARGEINRDEYLQKKRDILGRGSA